jgi:hypothetical protein
MHPFEVNFPVNSGVTEGRKLDIGSNAFNCEFLYLYKAAEREGISIRV